MANSRKKQLKKRVKNFKKKTTSFFKAKRRLIFSLFFIGSCLLVSLTIVISFFYPKDKFSKIKNSLLRNEFDSSSFSFLAHSLLENKRFQEAEKLIALGKKEKIDIKNLEEIIEKKQNLDPEEIIKQINYWENIVKEKKDYRDAFLKIALLYYQLGNLEKSKENAEKAFSLDENYQPTLNLLKKLSQDSG